MATSARKWGRIGAVLGLLWALLGLLSLGPAFALGGPFQALLIITLGPLYPAVALAAALGYPIGYWPPGARLLALAAVFVLYAWLGRLIARALARRRARNEGA